MDANAVHMTQHIIRNGRTHVMQEFTMKQAELEKVHVEIVKLIGSHDPVQTC
jgi:hypothetical protein